MGPRRLRITVWHAGLSTGEPTARDEDTLRMPDMTRTIQPSRFSPGSPKHAPAATRDGP